MVLSVTHGCANRNYQTSSTACTVCSQFRAIFDHRVPLLTILMLTTFFLSKGVLDCPFAVNSWLQLVQESSWNTEICFKWTPSPPNKIMYRILASRFNSRKMPAAKTIGVSSTEKWSFKEYLRFNSTSQINGAFSNTWFICVTKISEKAHVPRPLNGLGKKNYYFWIGRRNAPSYTN